jgi:hypothetical protein
MSEKGGFLGIWEDINENLIVDVATDEDKSSSLDSPLVTRFTVTNGAPKSDSTPEIFFEEVVLTVGVPPDLHVEKHTNLAGGESFTYEHRSRYSNLGKIVFSVEGTVSPSRLLRVKRAAKNIPPRIASLSITSYIEILKDINIHRWLKEVLETMLIPESGIAQAEIEALQNRLRNILQEISITKEQLQNIYSFIIRRTDTDKVNVNQHRKLVEDYLTHTSQACNELRKMLETHNAKTIDSTRNQLVNSLSKEADRIDQVSQSLLQ